MLSFQNAIPFLTIFQIPTSQTLSSNESLGPQGDSVLQPSAESLDFSGEQLDIAGAPNRRCTDAHFSVKSVLSLLKESCDSEVKSCRAGELFSVFLVTKTKPNAAQNVVAYWRSDLKL